MQKLTEAEEVCGDDHECVIEALEKMAKLLKCQGKHPQAVPLWIRVLEIQQCKLGPTHPDVVALRCSLHEVLENPSITDEAVLAFTEQLHIESRSSSATSAHSAPCLIASIAPQEAGHDAETAQQPVRNTAVEVAAAAGGAVMGGALQLGFSAASHTSSFVMDTTGRVMSMAARRSLGEGAGGVVVATGGAAVAATRAVAGSAVGAVQQAGVSLSASATSSAISFAGHHAVAGTSWAADGARILLRRVSGTELEPVGQSQCEASTSAHIA
jgi:hypothetical protein